MNSQDLLSQTAVDTVDMLRRGDVSPTELVNAQRERAEIIEPMINAIVTPCWERALQSAKTLEKQSPDSRGLLCGLPITIKDLNPVAGVRTTFGSLVYKDFIPSTSDKMVLQLESESAIVTGMTNSPEFGAGGHTFNEVHGTTVNPWNLSKIVGGSSGGAAASLSARTSWLSTGSDFAGSLRTPAAFCGVVGLRTSPYRIPMAAKDPFDYIKVNGPMARNIRDTGLFLDAMVFTNPHTPINLPKPELSFLDSASTPNTNAKIAYSPDLGLENVQPIVADVVATAMQKLQQGGLEIQPVTLDARPMEQAFKTLRAVDFATHLGGDVAKYGDLMKPEIVTSARSIDTVTGQDMVIYKQTRDAWYADFMKLFETVDVVICPATMIAPFDKNERYYGYSDGVPYEDYINWLSIAYVLTPLGLPVLCIPCGLDKNGLPVGIQIVGKPSGESALLQVGKAIEDILGTLDITQQELHRKL